MLNIQYDETALKAVILELVPAYQQGTLLDLIAGADVSEETIDATGMMLVGERREPGYIAYTGVPPEQDGRVAPSVWSCVRGEVYNLLCTDSVRYKSERKEGQTAIKSLVTIIATAVAAQFSLPVGVLTGAAVLGLMTALKVGVNGYCEALKPRPPKS
ncbi:hypothetical protein OR16_31819 [Cupriavidus basilensis OR16]|uniref:Uncharacterized protein n=1 Tax=Cupriavidus basilensis OR16 TaxID=1127483 RepID=H1SDI7_9BURK|nr:hypothetical protein [Cupriavidus basilensis]EHP39441.1 hypothetical protein OR16_31819 [Cupriavidus basilensis OR16]